MKKSVWIALGLVVAVAIVAVVITGNGNDKKSSSKTTASNSMEAPGKKAACAVFTLADAKKVLGQTAQAGNAPISQSNKDLDVSICDYLQPPSTTMNPSSTMSASLLIRKPKSDAGVTSNKNVFFGSTKPADAQAVSGYGDTAYWDPATGQLNILKHNTWYILSFGPLHVADRNLDQTKQLADLLAPKL